MSYQIVDARYAEGKKVIQAKDSRDGYKGRASYLAEALGGPRILFPQCASK